MDYLVMQIDRLLESLKNWKGSYSHYRTVSSEALQFLRDYAPNTYFFTNADAISNYDTYESNIGEIASSLDGFRSYIISGLGKPISLERQAQIEVVSDLLSQAEDLLNDKTIHPVAPVVIIGASLEEFLRNWCVDAELMKDSAKGSIENYAQALRAKELITKQDVKDITSWGGLRNEAAHGHWDSASNREAARLMLMGVNLFMRKYSPENRR